MLKTTVAALLVLLGPISAPAALAQMQDDHDERCLVVPLNSGHLIRKQVPIPTMMVKPSFALTWGKSQVGTIENLVGGRTLSRYLTIARPAADW